MVKEMIGAARLAPADMICRNIIDEYPDQPGGHHLSGVIALVLGLKEAAVERLELALELSEGSAEVRALLAQAKALPDPASPAGERFLLIKAWGCGFWSDISHVLGCLMLAEITGRVPVTHWGSNSLYRDGTGRDAFQLYFDPLSPGTLLQLRDRSSSIFPSKWKPDNLHCDNPTKPVDGLGGIEFLNRPEPVLVSDYYVGVVDLLPYVPKSHPLHGKPIDEVFRTLIARYLRPRPEIVDAVDHFYRSRLAGRSNIAVHVRGSDKVMETPHLDDLNRSYFEILDQEPGDTLILLLTDDSRWVANYQQRYGARVVVTDCYRTATRTGLHYQSFDRVRLGREILIDTYLATRCDRFLGGGSSNVSAMIAVLKDWSAGSCTLLESSQLHDRQLQAYVRIR